MLYPNHSARIDFMSLPPTFTISDAPSPSEFTKLFSLYAAKAHAIFDKVFSFFDSPSSSGSSASSYSGLLDIFDITPSESTALFKDELSRLVELVEGGDSSSTGDETFTALQLEGLRQNNEEFGSGSEIYKTACNSLKAVLQSVSSQTPCPACSYLDLIQRPGASCR